MINELFNARLLILVRKVRFAEQVAKDISTCINDLAQATDDPKMRHALNFFEGTSNSVHLLLESMFYRLESKDLGESMDELIRTVRTH